MPTMKFPLATALSITATAIQAGKQLHVSPFLGGQNHNALLCLDSPIGGAGVIKIQGNPSLSKTVPADGDAGWYDIATLNAASVTSQEIKLPAWIRTNITTLGTGTVNISLEGVQ